MGVTIEKQLVLQILSLCRQPESSSMHAHEPRYNVVYGLSGYAVFF